jgi:hypothetical protein
MVKKIRVIDDEDVNTPDETIEEDFQVSREMQELAKSMDWKLWEILQILQRFEKKLLVEETNAKSKK